MTRHENFETALDARQKGIVAIPVIRGTKTPAVKWKEWQTAMPPIELQREWFRERCNICIICRDMVLYDCDDPAKVELVIEKCGETLYKVKTPHGLHLGYRRRAGVQLSNRIDIKGLAIDLKTNGGLAMIPDSETVDGRYEWLGPGLIPISQLPVANIGWTRERVKKRVVPVVASEDLDFMERRALAWLNKVPGAISGQGGHNATMRVAGKLIQYFQLDLGRAFRCLKIWNEKCEPCWEDKDLEHKLLDAQKNKAKYPSNPF